MKRRFLLAAIAVLVVSFLAGCAAADHKGNDEVMHIFYPTDLNTTGGGDAVESVEVSWEELGEGTREEQAEAVIRRIIAGDEHHKSPLPAGTELRECRLAGGIVRVDFSGAYNQLSGIKMTVADYCLTLSLTELPDIYGVKITVLGEEPDHRRHGVLLAGNVLLTSTEDVVRELAAVLYFPDESGVLTKEERLLLLYEGQSRAGVVLDALQAKPQTDGLSPLLPEGFTVLSVQTDGNICYVNLSGDNQPLLPEGKTAQRQLLTGVAASLCSIEGIEGVQFLVNGEQSDVFGQLGEEMGTVWRP